ncbi:MAG TPA: cell division protein FtsQ/DivIB, partial [Steroidobacteraceae bacterium]|nr:cell division protein FtsQ/DivIB [Steroidobacteraceae bacterium]
PFKGKRTRNRIRAREEAAARPRLPWHAIAKALAIGGTALATFCVVFWALDQPIRTVQVTGRFQHVTPRQIERVVARQVRGKGLLTVDLGAVSRAIHALPWVDAVSVARQWPHGLTVSVVEQVAAARWGRDGLVNGSGVLFVTGVSRFPPGLARLSGPEGSEAEVTRRYLAMQRRLGPEGLDITVVRLDARGAWRLGLSDGIAVRLGRAQVDERFDKFMTAALGIVEHRAGDISYVDMRYTNGFAIGWKVGQAGAFQREHLTCPFPGALGLAGAGLRECHGRLSGGYAALFGGGAATNGPWHGLRENYHA